MSPDGRWYQGGACREAKQAHAGCFRQRAAVRSELCAVFATLGTFFRTATVSRVFAVPMSRVCNNKWLQQHAGGMMKSLILKRSVVLAGHKTSVESGRYVLAIPQGDRRAPARDPVGIAGLDRYRSSPRESLVGDSAVRPQFLPRPARSARAKRTRPGDGGPIGAWIYLSALPSRAQRDSAFDRFHLGRVTGQDRADEIGRVTRHSCPDNDQGALRGTPTRLLASHTRRIAILLATHTCPC